MKCSPLFSGIVPIGEGKTVCAGSEKFYKMCESNEVADTNNITSNTLNVNNICLINNVILGFKVQKLLQNEHLRATSMKVVNNAYNKMCVGL